MIKGLTGQRAELPQIGVLRKGGPKETKQKDGKEFQTYGKDLDYFRFDTEDGAAMAKFVKAFGQKPDAIKVYLPFRSTEENFDSWMEEYSAGGLKHRCDGEMTVLWQDSKGEYHVRPEEQKKCPGGCKATGRLKVIIPALERLAYVTVLTHSKHDLMNLDRQLRALEMGKGSLQGIPLILRRRPEEISTPNGAKRARREKSLLMIEAEPEWAQVLFKAQREAAFAITAGVTPPQLQLPPAAEIGDDYEEEDPEAEEIAIIKAAMRAKVPDWSDERFEKMWNAKCAHLSLEELRAIQQHKAKAAPAVAPEPIEAEPVDDIDAEMSAALDELEAMRLALVEAKMDPEDVRKEIVRLLPEGVKDVTECTPAQIDEIITGLNMKRAQIQKAA